MGLGLLHVSHLAWTNGYPRHTLLTVNDKNIRGQIAQAHWSTLLSALKNWDSTDQSNSAQLKVKGQESILHQSISHGKDTDT